MKINKASLCLVLLFLYSCNSASHTKLRIDIPRQPTLDLGKFNEIIMVDFQLMNEIKEFDIQQEVFDYFKSSFSQEPGKEISRKSISFPETGPFENEKFWKDLAPDSEASVFFSGSIEYTHETRKALVEKRKKQFEEPFSSAGKLVTQKFFTLKTDIYFIDSTTGKILLKNTFQETQSYKNPNQISYYAFFDLIYVIKEKLFRQILGRELLQERYLLYN